MKARNVVGGEISAPVRPRLTTNYSRSHRRAIYDDYNKSGYEHTVGSKQATAKTIRPLSLQETRSAYSRNAASQKRIMYRNSLRLLNSIDGVAAPDVAVIPNNNESFKNQQTGYQIPAKKNNNATAIRVKPAEESKQQSSYTSEAKINTGQPEKKKGFSGGIGKQVLVYLGISVGAVAAGIASTDVRYGQWMIGVYALAALIFKIDSQITFVLAMLSLIAVPFSTIAGKEGIAENFAVYSFLLLCTGVVCAVVELRRNPEDSSGESALSAVS